MHALRAGSLHHGPSGGACLVTERRYGAEQLHGRQLLAMALSPSRDLLRLTGVDHADGLSRRLAYLDIETTGLGGAGAMVFLAAAGWFVNTSGRPLQFVLRQYFAPSPPDEAALLDALVADIRVREADGMLVTYNGRSFDAPMLDSRATMHRLRGGFESLPHLDLLHVVRRGFRGLLPTCRLADVEASLLGVVRRVGDVAGDEVPARYFRFLRTGDARWMLPVLRHNADDVLSLVACVAWLNRLASSHDGASPTELLGIARIAWRVGDASRTVDLLELTIPRLRAGPMRDEARSLLARAYKRAGNHHLAVPLWEAIADSAGETLVALVELAKYHEHVVGDMDAALRVVDRGLAICTAMDRAREHGALMHRRDRLVRRLENRCRSDAADDQNVPDTMAG